MIVYGRNAVREALRGRRAGQVGVVLATEAAAREPWLRNAAVELAGRDELERLCGSPDHQGVCVDAGPYRYVSPESLLESEDALVVALDELQDPQNLGAICRTAECAGASGVVICERRAAEVTASVCKASAGAVEHLGVARVPNLARFLEGAKRAGAWTYGASAGGELSYDAVDYRGRVVLALGSEGRGLRRLVAERCDALVSLPLGGRISSLNVSAAAAVLMYGALQRRKILDRTP